MKAGKRRRMVLRRVGRTVAALAAAGAMIVTSGTPAAAYTPRFSFAGIGDWDGDGHQDLLARDLNGRLWLYPGESTGEPSTQRRVIIGRGLAGYTLVGPVDWDQDGHVDLLVRDSRGRLLLHIGESVRGTSTQGWSRLGQGFDGFSSAGMGDWDGDGHIDLIARDPQGRLWLYPGESQRGPAADARVPIGHGFTGFSFAGVADWDADGNVDFVARDPHGQVWLYPGESERGYSTERRVMIGHGIGGHALPDVADWDADGSVDMVTRDERGRLWLHPGDSSRGYSSLARLIIGQGW